MDALPEPPSPSLPKPEGAKEAEGEDAEAPGPAPGADSPYSGRPDWAGRDLPLEADGLPQPLRWRPVFLWRALAFGFLFDVAAEVLLQQLGKQILGAYMLFHAAVVGVVVGVVAPSVGRAAGVWWANRTLRKARGAAAAPAPPGVPP